MPLLVQALPACHSTCGTYASSCGDVDLAQDDWREVCGTRQGATGDMAFGDGTAVIRSDLEEDHEVCG